MNYGLYITYPLYVKEHALHVNYIETLRKEISNIPYTIDQVFLSVHIPKQYLEQIMLILQTIEGIDKIQKWNELCYQSLHYIGCGLKSKSYNGKNIISQTHNLKYYLSNPYAYRESQNLSEYQIELISMRYFLLYYEYGYSLSSIEHTVSHYTYYKIKEFLNRYEKYIEKNGCKRKINPQYKSKLYQIIEEEIYAYESQIQ